MPGRSGDPLSQPTRARLFALLGELRRPANTEELAERLQLHPNGVRTHLERLAEAGLVQREREHLARGRPRDTWTIDPDAQPGGDPPSAYADLGRWLVRALSAGGARIRDIEATGRQIGRELAAETAGTSGEQRMHTALVTLGFQPRREPHPKDRRLTYCLRNCPYREAAHEQQQVVCDLHRGLTRGLLDVIEPKTKLAGFVPSDPYTAGCLVKLHGPLATEAEGIVAADEVAGKS
ncbi:MAG TPA: helix-turn-helix domain-containing protein [Solirubrobacteraceae bacterium]